MRDLLDTIDRWQARGDTVALATVVGVSGSAPRPLGAKMVVNTRAEMYGSVSGGCVEAAVVELALEVIQSGQAQLVHFGISDETAWSVGLMCGGEIDVFIERLDERFERVKKLVRADQPFTISTIIRGDRLGERTIQLSIIANRQSQVQGTAQNTEVFIETIEPPPTLYIVGASHIAVALVTIAKTLGYRVTVVDPRSAFATPERFSHADALVIDYPQHVLTHERLNHTARVAVLTHDPKVDDPALIAALNSAACYVGALGSRRTHARRVERLKHAGLSDEQIARIHAPIGLNIGAHTPEEIALAVAAEMVQESRVKRQT